MLQLCYKKINFLLHPEISPPFRFLVRHAKKMLTLLPFVEMYFSKNPFHKLEYKKIRACFKQNNHGDYANDETQKDNYHEIE